MITILRLWAMIKLRPRPRGNPCLRLGRLRLCRQQRSTTAGLIAPSRRGRSQRLIVDIIVELGFARRETVEKAVASSREQGRPTGKILIEPGVIRDDQLARALAERFGVDYIDLSAFDVDKAAVDLITPDMAKHYQALPVSFLSDDTVLLAMADPSNVITIDELSMITGMTVRPASTPAEDISALIGAVSMRWSLPFPTGFRHIGAPFTMI